MNSEWLKAFTSSGFSPFFRRVTLCKVLLVVVKL